MLSEHYILVLQEGLSPIAWKAVEGLYPEAKAVMESALVVHVAMGNATYVDICRLLPGAALWILLYAD